ncbi:MAG TPA: hypothetical protein VMU89_06285, partial [Thermomicrobiaceae bacterium]|nr:hypothetical protein [Thermomicrobiaceae bacterium]
LATRFVERLTEFASHDVPNIDMASAVDRAREFQESARQLDDLSETWRGRIRAGAGDDGDRAADLLNHAQLRLSRILVPVASTAVGSYGQDRYGHAWQTQMIPSLVPYSKLASFSRDSEEFQTWWVAMVRARNRVTDALEQASAELRETLEELR